MSYSLPVHLLRQHLFCPRVPWFQELLDFRPPQTQWVRQGMEFHERQKEIFRHRTLKRFGLQAARRHFHYRVRSKHWRLHGVVDCVLETKHEVFAVEIKLAGRSPSRGSILQVAAYGMLLPETIGKPCCKAFIVLQRRGKTWPVTIDAKRINEVERVRDQIFANLHAARFPDSPATEAQCCQCEYLNYCNDRA